MLASVLASDHRSAGTGQGTTDPRGAPRQAQSLNRNRRPDGMGSSPMRCDHKAGTGPGSPPAGHRHLGCGRRKRTGPAVNRITQLERFRTDRRGGQAEPGETPSRTVGGRPRARTVWGRTGGGAERIPPPEAGPGRVRSSGRPGPDQQRRGRETRAVYHRFPGWLCKHG